MTSRFDVECRKQRGRAMPFVVVGAPLGLAGPHGQNRLGTIQSLDLADFSSTHSTRARSGGLR